MDPPLIAADRGRARDAPLIAAESGGTEDPQVKLRTAALSVASNSVLILLKVIAGSITGSVSILSLFPYGLLMRSPMLCATRHPRAVVTCDR